MTSHPKTLSDLSRKFRQDTEITLSQGLAQHLDPRAAYQEIVEALQPAKVAELFDPVLLPEGMSPEHCEATESAV